MKNITMNKIILFTLFLFSSISVSAADTEHYLLRQGDILEISVWGDETLSRELRILPDGSITFPLAGRVKVSGKTSTDVKEQITKKLKNYLQDPEVTVIVKATDGSRVFVLGKVAQPGPIPLTGPLTVLQALSIAGGFDKFADLDAIKILRSSPEGYVVLPVDYSALLEGKELEKNYILSADDTVLVP